MIWHAKREGDHCEKCKAVVPITTLCTVDVQYLVFTIYITCTVDYSQVVISLHVVVDISNNIPYAIDQDLLSKKRVSNGL